MSLTYCPVKCSSSKPLELDSFILIEKRNVDFVLDFEISQGVIYALIRRGNKRFVKCYDLEKTWLHTREESKDVTGLKKDCFGNIHVVSDYNVAQIFATPEEILTIETYSIAAFESQIEPCKVSVDNRIVVAKHSQHNKHVMLDLYHDKSKTQLANIWDRDGARTAASYYNDIIRLYYLNVPDGQNIIEIGVWDGDLVKLAVPVAIWDEKGSISSVSHSIQIVHWYLHISAKPLYCPVFGWGDNLHLFDFFNGQIIQYDLEGSPLNTTDISFQEDKNWLENVVFDEVNQVFYTTYQIKSTYVLLEIEMETGLLREVQSICKACYPENIQVYGGEMFYLYDFKIRRVFLNNMKNQTE